MTGKTNPSGKLVCTFPASYSGHYASTSYPPVDHKITYSEGLLMGYRWFDAKGLKPEFPFGFGLSYTKFTFSGLRIGPSSVSFRVKNTGRIVGTEVAQLYVSRPGGPEKRALHGFKRVHLLPGDSERITLPLKENWMSRWDVAGHKWVLDRGTYDAWVGDSSADLPLHEQFSR